MLGIYATLLDRQKTRKTCTNLTINQIHLDQAEKKGFEENKKTDT